MIRVRKAVPDSRVAPVQPAYQAVLVSQISKERPVSGPGGCTVDDLAEVAGKAHAVHSNCLKLSCFVLKQIFLPALAAICLGDLKSNTHGGGINYDGGNRGACYRFQQHNISNRAGAVESGILCDDVGVEVAHGGIIQL